MKRIFNHFFALTLLLTVCAPQLHAQYTLVPATVSLSPAEYTFADINGSVSVNRISSGNYVGNGLLNVGPPAGWPPVTPGCASMITLSLYQFLQHQANTWCREVNICLQASDCNWYMYIVKPTAPHCQFFGIAPYSPATAAYQLAENDGPVEGGG